MKAKDILKESIYALRNRKAYRFYSSQFKRYLALHHFNDEKAPGEDAYLALWHSLSKHVEPYSYRFFRHFCGDTPRIVPEDIGHSVIEDVLCPSSYRAVYSDKNLFPLIVGKENLPRIFFYRINGGGLLDSAYRPVDRDILSYLDSVDSLILKPSVHTSSGQGIKKFTRKGDGFVSVDKGLALTKEYLMSYNDNFCIQEAVEQHPFLSMLCPSSVNTIRISLYKSVKTDEPIVTASILRVGKAGKYVDNAHSGGYFAGIDKKTGELSKYVMDQYGNKLEEWNGIDYTKEPLVIPNWNKVLAFARTIGDRILHHRLIALDIALDKNGNPVLIEYNVGQFSYWLFMYTNQEVFGEYTDEVIDYCKKQYPKLKRNFKRDFGYLLKPFIIK